MSFMCGKWALTSSENLEGYLKAIGVNDENRAKALALMGKTGENGFMEEFSVKDESISRTLFVDGKQYGEPSPFVPFGKEVETQSLDGRPIKLTLKVEGNKFIRHESGPGYTSVNTNVVNGSERVLTMTSGSVVCTHKFKKV